MPKLKRIAEVTVALAQIANTVVGVGSAGSGLTVEKLTKTAADATKVESKRRKDDVKLVKIESAKNGRR